jgi:hypothetical protein
MFIRKIAAVAAVGLGLTVSNGYATALAATPHAQTTLCRSKSRRRSSKSLRDERLRSSPSDRLALL